MKTKRSRTRGVSELRTRIDRTDASILKLLAERRRMSRAMARVKEPGRLAIRDVGREEELLARLVRTGRARGLNAHFVTQVFHEIIVDSVRLQQDQVQQLASEQTPELLRVAFQGIEGAYSHLAALKFFSEVEDRLVFLGSKTFAEAIRAVENGQADCAILPIENTTSGGINEVYDALLHAHLSIMGEEILRVRHCLVGKKSIPLARIRRIYSHPQAVAQCSSFLSGLTNCQVEYYHDTAMSVEKVRDDGDPSHAAIASEEAARLLGLKVLRRGIANQEENYTRFLIVARNARPVDPRIPCKTSLVMATAQKPGSLVDALLVFRQHELNLTKLESRPVLGNPWEEMFYVDFEGNGADARVQAALDDLTRVTRFLRVLGTYPSRDLARTSLPARVLAEADGKQAPRASLTAEDEKPARTGGYKLASRQHKNEDTVIEVRGATIGGPDFVILPGPCSVESREQILECAREVGEYGGQILRGGCFKPRTSPYSFQGLGFEGLDYLVEAGRMYDMPVVTEVLSPQDVAPVAEKADILQIGARNMQNFTLLREAGSVAKPVMLKRGLMASIDELLQAAEYILAQGNQQVFLCERGIRTFETATRNTLDLSAIPILRELTHLPVIVDPSHAAGARRLVPPLALAAKAVGAHGLMVEIHPEPEKALSDGPQALRFSQFEAMMEGLFR